MERKRNCSTHHFPAQGGRVEVAIAHTGEGLYRPPHGLGDTRVQGPLHVLLREVAETAKYQHPHEDEEEEQAELLVALPHGVSHGLQTNRPPGQLEDPHDPRYPQHLQDPGHVPEAPTPRLLLGDLHAGVHRDALLQLGNLLVRVLEHERDVVRGDGENIDDVHCLLDEVDLLRSPCQPQQVLHGEPRDADGLQKRQVRVVNRLVL